VFLRPLYAVKGLPSYFCYPRKKADGSGSPADQALGRSRGGFTTKIHGAVSGLGLPVKVLLTPGQAADVSQAEELLEGLSAKVVIADKAYDSKALVDSIEARGAEAVIPSLSNRKRQREYDRERYKDRNLVERFWHKLKQYRRVATRYEKTAQNFLAFVHVASIMILLR
jgi:transposase